MASQLIPSLIGKNKQNKVVKWKSQCPGVCRRAEVTQPGSCPRTQGDLQELGFAMAEEKEQGTKCTANTKTASLIHNSDGMD